MTGMLIVAMSLLSSRSTSRPDLVGSARSSNTASGACSRARLRPSSPFFASTTANPSPASSAVVIVRVHGSSSITSTVRWPVAATVMLSLLSAQRPMVVGRLCKGNIPVSACQGGPKAPEVELPAFLSGSRQNWLHFIALVGISHIGERELKRCVVLVDAVANLVVGLEI